MTASEPARKPVFLNDISHLGVWYWIEIEGYDKMTRKQSGNFAFVECEIMGWDVETLGDLLQKQAEVNFAPRMRLWDGEEPPTAAERAAGEWRNDQRVWMPQLSDMRKRDGRYEEWCETGRTKWED